MILSLCCSHTGRYLRMQYTLRDRALLLCILLLLYPEWTLYCYCWNRKGLMILFEIAKVAPVLRSQRGERRFGPSRVRIYILRRHCIAVDHDEIESRADLNSAYQSLLRVYISSPLNERPPEALVHLLSSPRVRLIDLSHLEETHGTTLLHEAVRRKDLRMVELAVRAGADVFARDRRGRMAGDGHSKDDRVKVFLRQCMRNEFHALFNKDSLTHFGTVTNQDPSLLGQQPSTEPPEMRGYLNKYTNVAKGYSTRWFVLKDGVLSCKFTILPMMSYTNFFCRLPSPRR